MLSLFCRLSNLDNLEMLDLSINRFSKNFPEVVCELVSLKELNLSSCSISKLPSRCIYCTVIYICSTVIYICSTAIYIHFAVIYIDFTVMYIYSTKMYINST